MGKYGDDFSVSSVAVIKHPEQKQHGEVRVYWLYTSRSQPITSGTEATNSIPSTQGRVLLLLAFSTPELSGARPREQL